MPKLYIRKHDQAGWRWWYVAFGNWQPFKRFEHGGWVCLRFKWFRTFWNGANSCGAPPR